MHIPAATIFTAIEAGHVSEVQRLLDADPGLADGRLVGRNPDGTPQRGSDCATPLQIAAAAGQLAIVKLLIERGAEIYEAAQWGYPAVDHALSAKRPAVVAYLLGEAARHPTMLGAPTYGLGLDVNLAARYGMADLVKAHLSLDKLAVHRRGIIGETPLHWAAHNGHEAIVRMLLDAGADIEADEIGCYGGKPLHWASEHEPQVVRLLLARGAKVNSRNVRKGSEFEGATPLIMVATQRDDCAECAEFLLAAGADLKAVDAKGRTALDWARQRGAKRIEAALTKHGAG
jgi:ankyrin repeat protein